MAERKKGKRRRNDAPPGNKGGPAVLAPVPGHLALAWTAAIFLLHTCGLLLLFKPTAGLFNELPLIDQDWGLHFHHLRSLEQFWRQDARLWGYNPLFMAGYPSNTIQDLSIKFYELSAVLLSTAALSALQWFKLLVFFSTAFLPWLAYCAARNFWPQDEFRIIAPLAALLAAAYWWNSLPREMLFYGMVGFPVACYLAVYAVSLCYRLAQPGELDSSTQAAWLATALVLPALHVQTAVIVAFPLAAMILLKPGLLRGRFMLWMFLAAIVSLAADSFWLVPALAHLKDENSRAIVEQLALFASNDPLTFVKDYLGSKQYWSFRGNWAEKGFRLMLLVLGGLGLAKLIRARQKFLVSTLVSGIAALFLITYFGSLVPAVKAWQPLRFKVPLDLFLILPAAYICALWATNRQAIPRSFIVPAVAAAGTIALFVNLMGTEASGRMLLRTGLRPDMHALIEWLRNETPAGARVLFEESGDETGFVYDGMYLSSFAAHESGRELIGGPINLYNDRHHFAEFHSGKLFQKEIHRLSDEQIRSYLAVYNVGAIVAFHPESVRRLQRFPGLIRTERRIGPIHLMRVHQPFTWFLEGSGDLEAGLNRIQLKNLSGGAVVLKYHWIHGLTASPPAQMVPVPLADDPIPFIKIINPPRELTLTVR